MKKKGHEFAWSERLGFICTCPSNLGTGLRASVHVQLHKLSKVLNVGASSGRGHGDILREFRDNIDNILSTNNLLCWQFVDVCRKVATFNFLLRRSAC